MEIVQPVGLDYPRIYLHLGSVLKEKGRLEKAIAEFKEPLKLKPNFEEARRNLQQARPLQSLTLPPTLCQFTYVNTAWGNQDETYYLDNQGNVYK